MAASRSDSRREQNSEATDAEFLKGYIRLFSHFPNPGVGRLDKITSFLLLTNLIFNCLPDDGTTHEKIFTEVEDAYNKIEAVIQPLRKDPKAIRSYQDGIQQILSYGLASEATEQRPNFMDNSPEPPAATQQTNPLLHQSQQEETVSPYKSQVTRDDPENSGRPDKGHARGRSNSPHDRNEDTLSDEDISNNDHTYLPSAKSRSKKRKRPEKKSQAKKSLSHDGDQVKFLYEIRHNQDINCVKFSPDSTYLATVGGQSLCVLDVRNVTLLLKMENLCEDGTSLQSLCFQPLSTYLAVGGSGTGLQVWQIDTKSVVSTYPIHTNISSIDWSLNCEYIAFGADNTIHVFKPSIPTGQMVWQKSVDGHVNAVAISLDSCSVVVGSSDKKVTLWEINYGSKIWQNDSHLTSVISIGFNSLGIVSASTEGNVKIFAYRSRRKPPQWYRLKNFETDKRFIGSIAYGKSSKSSRWIIVGSTQDGCVEQLC